MNMAPASTPNPHRFLINKIHTPLHSSSQQPTPQSSQRYGDRFRFNVKSSQYRHVEASSASAGLPRFSTPIKLNHEDSIEDEPSEDALDDEGEEENFGSEEDMLNDNDDVAHEISQRASKRRKLYDLESTRDRDQETDIQQPGSSPGLPNNDTDELDQPNQNYLEPSSSSIPVLSSPDRGSTKFYTSTPRFRFRENGPYQATPPQSLPPSTSRPQFLLPALEPHSSPQEPLPDHFSPSKRGQRYIAGGLASTMQSWLLNIDTLPTTSLPQQTNTQEKSSVTIMIDEISGSPMVGTSLIRGRQLHQHENGEVIDHLGIVNVILAGKGYTEGLRNGGSLGVGRRVSVKGPMWEIRIEGRKWGVGVNWRVL